MLRVKFRHVMLGETMKAQKHTLRPKSPDFTLDLRGVRRNKFLFGEKILKHRNLIGDTPAFDFANDRLERRLSRRLRVLRIKRNNFQMIDLPTA